MRRGVRRGVRLGDLPDAVLADAFARLDYVPDGRALHRVSKRVRALARAVAWHPDPLRPMVAPEDDDEAVDVILDLRRGLARAFGAVRVDERDSRLAGPVLRAMGRVGARPASIHVGARELEDALGILERDAGASSRAARLALEIPTAPWDFESESFRRIARRLPALEEFSMLTRGPVSLHDIAYASIAIGSRVRFRLATAHYRSEEPRVEHYEILESIDEPTAFAARIDQRTVFLATAEQVADAGEEIIRAGARPEPSSVLDEEIRWLVAFAHEPGYRMSAADVDVLARWFAERAAEEPRLRVSLRDVRLDVATRLIGAARPAILAYGRTSAAELADPDASREIDALVDAARTGRLENVALAYRADAGELAGQLHRLRGIASLARTPAEPIVEVTIFVDADEDEYDELNGEVARFFELERHSNLSVEVL